MNAPDEKIRALALENIRKATQRRPGEPNDITERLRHLAAERRRHSDEVERVHRATRLAIVDARRREGMEVTTIASLLELSRQTVHRVLREDG